MGTTTNNGWTYPESTDLVKDGATAIETLATDIDTTLGVYAPSTSGLELINTTSFSGVASQNFSNVFSSTYTNYKVLISNVTNTADNLVNLRFRENVTDKATNYKTSVLRVVSNNTVAGTFAASATAIAWTVQNTGAVPTYGVLEISRPSATTGLCYSSAFDLSNNELRTMFAVNSDMSNFTGFSIFPSAGNVSGTVSIYGYNV